MLVTLIMILLPLLLLSAFFSASETSFIAASKAKIHKMKLDGNKKAVQLERLLHNKERIVTVALLGNNITNVMASSIATVIMVSILGDNGDWRGLGIALVTISMTIIIFLFGEVIPKAFALHYAENIAFFSTSLFRFLIRISFPVIWFSNVLTNIIFRICKANRNEKTSMSAGEELRIAIDMQHSQGLVVKNDRDMLDSILNLGETSVRAIVQHRNDVFAIDIDENKDEILSKIIASPYSRIPFYREKFDNIIGVLHVRTFLKELHHRDDFSNFDLASRMRKPIFVPYSTTLKNQLTQFKKTRSHMAFVVDEYGGVMGIITLEDLIEEIVGDIEDEHDDKNSDVTVDEKNVITVAGDYPVRDFNRKFDTKLDDNEAITIAGLIIAKIERIPKSGEEIELFGYHIHIKEIEGNRITLLSMRKLLSEANDDAQN